MSTKTIEAEIAESNAQVVDTVFNKPVTRGGLSAAFDKVRNQQNWKMPVDAVVDVSGDFELQLIERAVIFFTGSVPSFHAKAGGALPGCRYRVCAAGYYKTIGA